MARRKLEDSVVIITSASSGIGRARTPLRPARGRRGPRRPSGGETARGSRRVRVPGRKVSRRTDGCCADLEAVEELARKAIEHFGRGRRG